MGETEPRLAVVQVPSGLRRLVRPAGGDGPTYVLLEDIVRSELASLFPGQTVLESAAFRVARDAELELDDEGGRPYLEALEEELKKRRSGQVIRLEVEAGIGDALLGLLTTRLEVEAADVYRVRFPLDMRGLWPLTELPALEHLREPALRPLPTVDEEDPEGPLRAPPGRGPAAAPPVRVLRPGGGVRVVRGQRPRRPRHQADALPHQRRVALVRALARAADAGKQVTVLVELMARFDEQSNIRWARRLEEAGAHVIYGIRGYKTHAKICLVVRRGRNGIERYVHLGTGNYNEKTARIYTDFGLMTADPVIGEDASAFFNALTGYSDPPAAQEARHGADHAARARAEADRARAAPRGGRAGRRDPRQDERARRRGDDPRALRRFEGGRAHPPERAGRLLPPAGPEGRLRHDRGGVDRGPLPGARADLLLPERRRRGAVPRQRRLDAAQPRPADRAAVPGVAGLPRQGARRARRHVRGQRQGAAAAPDGSYKRKKPTKGEEPFRAQVRLYQSALRSFQKAAAASGIVLEPIATPVAKA
jgi:hypothetical protein